MGTSCISAEPRLQTFLGTLQFDGADEARWVRDELGWRDTPGGSVEIPLKGEQGEPVGSHSWSEDDGGRWWWDDTAPAPYGLETLPDARSRGRLLLVGGVKVWLPLRYRKIPTLWSQVQLSPDQLRGIEKLYILCRPIKWDQKYAEWVIRGLMEIGWQGEVYLHTLCAASAVSDSHAEGDDAFERDLEIALMAAERVRLCPAASPKQAVAVVPAQQQPVTATHPTLEPAALHGLAGDIVRAIEPHTEADPAGLLVANLVQFGCAAGRNAYFTVEATRHYPNLFAGIVGQSSKARKGTSQGHVDRIYKEVLPDWKAKNVLSGLSSGEGLIWAVRDEDGSDESRDKRLLVFESELASTLKVMTRNGNTLSALVRQAWDDGSLGVMTKNAPARATDAHISIIGHITQDELVRYLDATEVANGFANRFLWVGARRSKFLPEGGCFRIEDAPELVTRLGKALEAAQTPRELVRDEEARALWLDVYRPLSEGKHGGLVGAVTSRAEAQVTRLSLVYALLDQSPAIRRIHLEAALAVWRYCEESAEHIFAGRLGNRVADEILAALRNAPRGLTRTEISDLFKRHKSRDEIDAALTLLAGQSRARRVDETTAGRSTERWLAV